jgi:hypothetical protein
MLVSTGLGRYLRKQLNLSLMADNTANNSTEKSICTVYFKGAKNDFTMWYEGFMSSAHLKILNNKKVLLGLINVPKESVSLEGGTPEDKLKRTYRKANNQS